MLIIFWYWHTLNPLDVFAFVVHHETSKTGDDAAKGHKRTSGPRRSLVSVIVIHVKAQNNLEKSVPHIHPNNVIHFPAPGRRSVDTSRGSVRDFGMRNRHSRVLGAGVGCICEWRQGIRAWQSEPPTMYARQSSNAYLFRLGSPQSPFSPEVYVSESPGGQTESSHAEEGVENLRVNLDPNSSWRLYVIAGRFAHGRSGIAEE